MSGLAATAANQGLRVPGGVWASVSGDPGRQTYFGKSVGLGEPARSVTRSITSSLCHTASAVWQRVNRIRRGEDRAYLQGTRGGARPAQMRKAQRNPKHMMPSRDKNRPKSGCTLKKGPCCGLLQTLNARKLSPNLSGSLVRRNWR